MRRGTKYGLWILVAGGLLLITRVARKALDRVLEHRQPIGLPATGKARP